MKIYLDLQKQAITKTTDENIYQGDIYSNAFEVLFYNYTDTNWFPTMSQLAPNGRSAGEFTADALGEGETHEYTEDGVTYLKFTFTMGTSWVLMKGRSEFYIWFNRLGGAIVQKKCVGKVNVMIDHSTDDYFIADPTFNPNVKAYIDACIAELGDGSPKYFDTAENIANCTEDKGLAVATDTGHVYYWDETKNTTTKYTDSGLVYNDLSNYYNQDQMNYLLNLKADKSNVYQKSEVYNKPETNDLLDLKADKSTAITHTDNQLKDYSGNNIYPNIDPSVVYHSGNQLKDENNNNFYPALEPDTVISNQDWTIATDSGWTNLAGTKRFAINYGNEIPVGITFDLSLQCYYSNNVEYDLLVEIWTNNNGALTRVDYFTYTCPTHSTMGFYENKIIESYTNEYNYPLLITLANPNGNTIKYVQNISGNSITMFSDLVSTSLSLSSSSTLNNYDFRYAIVLHTDTIGNIKKKLNSFVTVKKDGTGDYSSINEALTNIDEGTPIILYEGVYEETIYMPSVAVNIRGVDKNKCIIKSTSGLYANCTMYIKSGVLKDLTIIAEYVNGTSSEIGTSNGAYAVHIENETSANTTMEIDNCVLRSDFSAAAGIGLRKGSKLIIRNSVLINNQVSGRGSYESNGALGALYCHDSAGVEGNSKAELYNNLFLSNLGTAICFYHVPDKDGNTVDLTLTNNVLKDKVNGYGTNTIWERNNAFTYFSISVGYGNSNSIINE